MSQFSENELINLICNAKNFIDVILIYHINISQLRDYTILIFDNNMTKSINRNPPLDLTDKLKSVKVVSIFNSSFCFLNEKMHDKLLINPKAFFEYKNCFNLDVNIMNILVDYHNNIRTDEFISIVSDLDLFLNDVTCYPYMMENAGKLCDDKLQNCVINTLLIFNKFKHSNLHTFSTEYSNTEQDYQNTKETIDLMKNIACNDGQLSILDPQKTIYALLLKTAILSLRNNNGIKKKVTELMEFINNDLGIFLERETVYCYWFLKNKNDGRIKNFFRYIQPNVHDIIGTIQGMSWDLYHLRFCTEIGPATDIANGTICMHYLVTKDNGLADLANAHPIKFLIYKKGDITAKTVCEVPIYDIITEIDIIKILSDNEKMRKENYSKRNIDCLIKFLEQELQSLCIVS